MVENIARDPHPDEQEDEQKLLLADSNSEVG